MSLPGHEYLYAVRSCSCGWKPELRSSVSPEKQWGYHVSDLIKESAPRRTSISREVALQMLQKIAGKTGDQTLPNEDVIDLAQAILALYE